MTRAREDIICDLIVDHVVELLGRRYRKSQIKLELQEINGGTTVDWRVADRIISLARMKIRDVYGVDPVEYKGASIEFYSSVIRDPKSRTGDKLQACERIDKLLGLEHLSDEDPKVYAAKVAEALKAMDDSVTGVDEKESGSGRTAETSVTPIDADEHDDSCSDVTDSEIAETFKDATTLFEK